MRLYDLNSNRVITRTTVTVIPVTQVIIDTINSIGNHQGISSLKFTNRRKVPFYPTNWIAGVDYDDDIFNNIRNNTEEDEEDEDYDYDFDNNNIILEDNDYDNDIDDSNMFDRVDQQEIDELLAPEPGENAIIDNNNTIEANPTNEDEGKGPEHEIIFEPIEEEKEETFEELY